MFTEISNKIVEFLNFIGVCKLKKLKKKKRPIGKNS